MLEKLFKELGLSENAHRIYMRLLENGASSARALSENLNIPRASVYDNLNMLVQKGLAVERAEENKKFFEVDDVKNLPRLVTERMDALKKERESLDELLPRFLKGTSSVEPKMRFYSGVEGVRQVLNDIHWYKNLETMSLWPVSEMVELLGKEYFAEFNRRRIRQKLFIRAIWPQDKKLSSKEYPFLGTGGDHLRDLRIAPKDTTWDMGYWIYADKVAFLSSRKETFGFVIQSRDFAEMMKMQFEAIWDTSKPIKPEPEYTDAFLKTI